MYIKFVQKKLRSYYYAARNNKCKEWRQAVLDKFGSKCAYCGFDDIRALQLDHVNGGGTKEHLALGNCGIYKKAVYDTKNNYQLLCANCNWIKRYERKEVRKL